MTHADRDETIMDKSLTRHIMDLLAKAGKEMIVMTRVIVVGYGLMILSAAGIVGLLYVLRQIVEAVML